VVKRQRRHGAAVGWSDMRVEAHGAMGTIGAACAGVGFMPECSARVAVLIGPPGELIYFSRRQNRDHFPLEQQRMSLLRTSPTMWQAFPGSTKPCLKTRDDWWSNMEYVKWEPLSDPELQFVNNIMAKVQEVAAKHVPEVQSWYDRDK
jgi:hypothetical protein